ncbi:hypothetical protein BDV26DRAFT_260891 [Aspergillus bertholletiae]|uniref:Uncharacterized protein n=1 Tax=Aspergillus bertholletiae TaxID=1226010 RepID=A0A5N7BAU2_9EURO|nr:hypothetical protein BDV26DRAFT_260891 [Aspergillus bertholletiae]
MSGFFVLGLWCSVGEIDPLSAGRIYYSLYWRFCLVFLYIYVAYVECKISCHCHLWSPG